VTLAEPWLGAGSATAATADVLRARILRYLASEAQPELADIRIVRGPADLVPQMPDYVTAFLAHQWGTCR